MLSSNYMKTCIAILALLIFGTLPAQEVVRQKITLRDGTVYENARITAESDHQLVIICKIGAFSVEKKDLVPELQAKFNYREPTPVAAVVGPSVPTTPEITPPKQEVLGVEEPVKETTPKVSPPVPPLTPAVTTPFRGMALPLAPPVPPLAPTTNTPAEVKTEEAKILLWGYDLSPLLLPVGSTLVLVLIVILVASIVSRASDSLFEEGNKSQTAVQPVQPQPDKPVGDDEPGWGCYITFFLVSLFCVLLFFGLTFLFVPIVSVVGLYGLLGFIFSRLSGLDILGATQAKWGEPSRLDSFLQGLAGFLALTLVLGFYVWRACNQD